LGGVTGSWIDAFSYPGGRRENDDG